MSPVTRRAHTWVASSSIVNVGRREAKQHCHSTTVNNAIANAEMPSARHRSLAPSLVVLLRVIFPKCDLLMQFTRHARTLSLNRTPAHTYTHTGHTHDRPYTPECRYRAGKLLASDHPSPSTPRSGVDSRKPMGSPLPPPPSSPS